MESIRHFVLQAELKRIEAEAEANSYAIMNKADQLAQAHMLCHAINAGLDGIRIEPMVDYGAGLGCDITVDARLISSAFMKQVQAIGLTIDRAEEGYGGQHELRFTEYPGVSVYIKSEAVIYADNLVEQAA